MDFFKHKHIALIIIFTLSILGIMFPQNVFAGSVPDIPENLSAEATGSVSIELTWDEVDEATSYYVFRSITSAGTYKKIATTDESYYTDEDLDSAQTYYYRVKAHNSDGTSAFSAKASDTTDESDLDAPENLQAEALDSTTIEVTWDEVDEADYYYVYRSASASGTYSKIAKSSDCSYTDEDLDTDVTHYYKVKSYNGSSTSAFSEYVSADSPSAASKPSRLAGNNRYATAAAIAASGWTTSYYAIIASGETYPDALCSAPLAYLYNAPILLTAKNTLLSETKTQLSGLRVKSVFIIGGTGVISSAVEQSIAQMGIQVTRIAGTDRYDTSLKVAEVIAQSSGASTKHKAVLVTGTNFPDALSVASIAAMKAYPILLTPKDSLGSSLKSYLKNHCSSTIVIGDTNSISAALYAGLPSPVRIYGSDRYATNLAVIQAFSADLSFDTCYLATGLSFPDALAGLALAAQNKAPVFLVGTTLNSATANFIQSKDPNKLVTFGGPSAIQDTVLNALAVSVSSSISTLSVPTNLKAEAISSSEIDLIWDEVADATSYFIYRATSSTGTYAKIATTMEALYSDDHLLADKTYYYKVCANNSSGKSNYSSCAEATTSESNSSRALDAPEDPKAEATSSSTIILSWDEVADAAYYNIYRSTSSSGTYSLIAATTNTTYTDRNLTADQTYYYRINAYDGENISDFSTKVHATTDGA